MTIKFKSATIDDVPLIRQMMRDLAMHQKLDHKFMVTDEILRKTLFSTTNTEVIISYFDDNPSGVAVFSYNYNIFAGKTYIYLEELYVVPESRMQGIAKSLLGHLAGLCQKHGYNEIRWSCLHQNILAINFYEKIGAVSINHDWMGYTLTGDKLDKLAKSN